MLIRAQSQKRLIQGSPALDLDDGEDAALAGEDVDLSGSGLQAKAENLIATRHQKNGSGPFRKVTGLVSF